MSTEEIVYEKRSASFSFWYGFKSTSQWYTPLGILKGISFSLIFILYILLLIFASIHSNDSSMIMNFGGEDILMIFGTPMIFIIYPIMVYFLDLFCGIRRNYDNLNKKEIRFGWYLFGTLMYFVVVISLLYFMAHSIGMV